MLKKLSNKGFSAVEVVIVIAIVGVLGLVGFLVWQKNKDANSDKKQPSNQSQQGTPKDNEETAKQFTVLDGKMAFVDDGTWKVATGGYWSLERGRCGRGTDFDKGCLDHLMLIPSGETFTNPDQYHANISVFEDDREQGQSLEAWVDANVGPGGQSMNPKRSYPKIAGYEGYRYEVAYSEKEIRLAYGILVEDKIVVVRSTFYKGDYLSVKTANDYLPFISKVDALVSSMSVN
jgi:prepilin-type N-terminal cleavage/methylation domain-containing protein